MKRLFSMFTLLIASMLIVPPAVASAQSQMNPNTIPSHFYYNLNSGKAYAQNTIDTLAGIGLSAGTHYLGSGFKVAGMGQLSYTISVADSSYGYIYIDHRPTGSTAWAQVYLDSIEVDEATLREIQLRGTAVDRIGQLSGAIRRRIVWQNVTQGIMSATYSDWFNFKP